MREISYARSALKVLGRMPANESKRLRAKIVQYARDPASLANNVTALLGWRVIMDDRGQVLQILTVGPRGGVYE